MGLATAAKTISAYLNSQVQIPICEHFVSVFIDEAEHALDYKTLGELIDIAQTTNLNSYYACEYLKSISLETPPPHGNAS